MTVVGGYVDGAGPEQLLIAKLAAVRAYAATLDRVPLSLQHRPGPIMHADVMSPQKFPQRPYVADRVAGRPNPTVPGRVPIVSDGETGPNSPTVR